MSRPILIALAVAIVALAIAGCSPLTSQQVTGVPGDTPNAAAAPANKAVCLQNEQTLETQVQAWAASSPDQPVPATLDGLKSAGAIREVPTCPNGGTYSWDGKSLTCSVDGHWQ